MALDERKLRAELLAQGWNPTQRAMSSEHIQDAKAVLLFKFLAATNPFYLIPQTHFKFKNYVDVLQKYAENLVSRKSNFLHLYAKFLK